MACAFIYIFLQNKRFGLAVVLVIYSTVHLIILPNVSPSEGRIYVEDIAFRKISG